MLIETITSRQNPLIKRLNSVRENYVHSFLFIEGINLAEEALKSNLHIEVVIYCNRLFTQEKGPALWEKLQTLPCRGVCIQEKLFDSVSSVGTAQGIILLATRPCYDMNEIFNQVPTLMVMVDGLQNPGNLGAMIRTAEASGATGFVTISHTADPFQHKSLRASSGSAFRFPIIPHQSLDDILKLIREKNIQIVTASAQAALHFSQYDWTQPTALWLGSENHGLSNRIELPVNQKVFIPMAGQTESLNISIASSLLLYEAFRQRNIDWLDRKNVYKS